MRAARAQPAQMVKIMRTKTKRLGGTDKLYSDSDTKNRIPYPFYTTMYSTNLMRSNFAMANNSIDDG